MSFENEIEAIEIEIKALSEILCEALVSGNDIKNLHEVIRDPQTPSEGLSLASYLNSVESDFRGNGYHDAIYSLEWGFENNKLILPGTAQLIWADIKFKAEQALDLHRLKRLSDDGFKDPITHIEALGAADEQIPDDFCKRYGLKAGDAKSLSLVSPNMEERFIRERVAEAAARGVAHYGQCRYAKRRYKLSEEQAERLVDDIWENPNTVSKVFHELFDWEKLLKLCLDQESQERVLQIRADYNNQYEVQ